MTEILEKENHPLDLPRHIGIILEWTLGKGARTSESARAQKRL